MDKRRAVDGQRENVENKKGPPPHIRVRQIQRWFQVCYGNTLPNNAEGRELAFVMCCHLARCLDAPTRIRNWLSLDTPWMKLPERNALLASVIRQPYDWSADTLAQKWGITDAIRNKFGLWTIGAIDVPKAEREARRRERKRQREEARRRARGAEPRADYEATSIERTKPWLAENISRRTWFRRRGTGPCPVPLEDIMVGTDLCHRHKRVAERRVLSITEGHLAGGVFPTAVSRSMGM
jgi:hypothetical protein